MHAAPLIAWKQAPFIRLLLPFIAGIVCQYYLHCPICLPVCIAVITSFVIVIISSASPFKLFQYRSILHSACFLLIFSFGSWRTIDKEQQSVYHVNCESTQTFIAILREPVSEKQHSFKAMATIQYMINADSIIPAKANIILYFQKNTAAARLYYGDKIVFRKQLQPVKPASNPGNFDYKKWCALQGIFFQTYLSNRDFQQVRAENKFSFQKKVFQLRDEIIGIIRKYIPGKKEAGLAEALLIGYKDDLDKPLMQSYSNTGIIHVIAISGLHLGIIYFLLAYLCKPLTTKKSLQIFRPVFIISGLWLFGLLAGGTPSVLRSAVMFTCLTIGETISKKSSVYNSLAASAFLLLFYNPLWLWDAGFQLSYTAIGSIALFQQPLYHSIDITNKYLVIVWKMISTTLAAQILTTPVTLFLFHQFPLLFLFTNLMAIPLSSLILMGEILLCCLASFPVIARPLGNILSGMIRGMNSIVETIDKLPFASVTQIQINPVQVVLLYCFIAAIAIWLMHKAKKMVIAATTILILFFSITLINKWKQTNQKLILVYHIPRRQAIDIISGNHYFFRGDTTIMNNFNMLQYTLNPARQSFSAAATASLPDLYNAEHLMVFGNKTLLLIDSAMQLPLNYVPPALGSIFDVLLISHNPKLKPDQLLRMFPAKMVVIDGSNSSPNTRKWLESCKKSGISFHSTAEKGAFVLNAY